MIYSTPYPIWMQASMKLNCPGYIYRGTPATPATPMMQAVSNAPATPMMFSKQKIFLSKLSSRVLETATRFLPQDATTRKPIEYPTLGSSTNVSILSCSKLRTLVNLPACFGQARVHGKQEHRHKKKAGIAGCAFQQGDRPGCKARTKATRRRY